MSLTTDETEHRFNKLGARYQALRESIEDLDLEAEATAIDEALIDAEAAMADAESAIADATDDEEETEDEDEEE